MKDNLFLALLYALLFCVFIWLMYLDHDYRKFDLRIGKLENFFSQFSIVEGDSVFDESNDQINEKKGAANVK